MPRLPILLLSILLLAGSFYTGFYRGIVAERPRPTLTSPGLDQFAREYIEVLRRQGNSGVDMALFSSTLAPRTRAEIQKASEILGAIRQPPMGLELVATSTTPSEDATIVPIQLNYEMQTSDRWYRIEVHILEAGEQRKISGIKVEPAEESLVQSHQFSLREKPLQAYVILAVAVIESLFVLWVLGTLVFHSRDRLLKQALWAFLIVTGVGTVQLNWESGEVRFHAGVIRFPIVTVSRPSYFSPLYFTISCPLGALVYFRRQQSNGSRNTTSEPVTVPASGESVGP